MNYNESISRKLIRMNELQRFCSKKSQKMTKSGGEKPTSRARPYQGKPHKFLKPF